MIIVDNCILKYSINVYYQTKKFINFMYQQRKKGIALKGRRKGKCPLRLVQQYLRKKKVAMTIAFFNMCLCLLWCVFYFSFSFRSNNICLFLLKVQCCYLLYIFQRDTFKQKKCFYPFVYEHSEPFANRTDNFCFFSIHQ